MSDVKSLENDAVMGDGKFGTGSKVQELFLNHIMKNHMPVTVFLMCGVRLQGIVTSYDAATLLLKREGHTQLVFKHSISTIMPSEIVQLSVEGEQKEVIAAEEKSN